MIILFIMLGEKIWEYGEKVGNIILNIIAVSVISLIIFVIIKGLISKNVDSASLSYAILISTMVVPFLFLIFNKVYIKIKAIFNTINKVN